ncbi:uncharacterized protein [Linepithema humile]|uniref:uncharacterized protein n=1 Tax=Linepithema humile TaxID=83485 RepID=UPI000623383C|nr:PREDICTED: uncharacterized protein LOC105676013 [Linepithema humile]
MENGSFAINRSAEETAKQFQVYLRKHENDDKLVISEVVDKPGSKIGDNYTSVLIRSKLVGTRGDGSPYAKTFMTKTLSLARGISNLVDLTDLFRMEAYVYQKILPTLGPFGPQCIHADEENIIMEDLAEKGYTNCERRNFLDLDHSVYALRKLAKLHASALAIKIKDPRQFDKWNNSMTEVFYKDASETSAARMCTEMCTQLTLKYLEVIEPRTQELQNVIDHISTYNNKTYDTMHRLFNGPKQKYFTICHGDPWTNNLLYLHDKNGRILDLKMVDYQISRHISVSTDILYLIYSSVQSSLIEKSFESLIKIYHNEFIKELRRCHVNEKILAEVGTEWLNSELKAFSFYGAVVGCFLVNPILAEEEEALQFESGFGPENPLFTAESVVNPKKLDRIKQILLHYYRRFVENVVRDDLQPIPIT